MAPATRQVAAEIFASQPVQAVVVHGQYTEEFIANQCILAAGELVALGQDQKLDEDGAKVAIGAFTALVGRIVIGGKQSDFRALAEIACQRAAAFKVYFDRAAKKAESAASGEPAAQDAAPEASAEPQPASSDPADLPVEQLGLPKLIEDLLQGAGLTTVRQVREADAKGEVLAIDGIGPQAHKKIVAAVEAKLSPVS